MPATTSIKGYLFPTSYGTTYLSKYFRNCIVDDLNIIFAIQTDSSLYLFGLLVNEQSSKVTTRSAYKFKTTFAFMNPIKFEHIELCMADLAFVCLITFVDTFIN